MSAKGIRRCLAETGSASATSSTKTRVVLGSLQVAEGEAECAITQTVHWASSRELECWWTATLNAETHVSNRHSHAAGFNSDRMEATPPVT